jgi:flagellar motility protein MotE (MotC chaperone)
MDAKSAARLMEGLETEQAVEVLAGMKGDISGAILANMDNKTASRIIKLLAAYKGPRGSVQ